MLIKLSAASWTDSRWWRQTAAASDPRSHQRHQSLGVNSEFIDFFGISSSLRKVKSPHMDADCCYKSSKVLVISGCMILLPSE